MYFLVQSCQILWAKCSLKIIEFMFQSYAGSSPDAAGSLITLTFLHTILDCHISYGYDKNNTFYLPQPLPLLLLNVKSWTIPKQNFLATKSPKQNLQTTPWDNLKRSKSVDNDFFSMVRKERKTVSLLMRYKLACYLNIFMKQIFRYSFRRNIHFHFKIFSHIHE